MESKECMKCGRELSGGQIFCDNCLAEMDKYPVRPGVVVMLPRRRQQPPKPAAPRRRPTPTPEEQVLKLKKRVKIQSLALALVTLLLAASVWLQVSYQLEKRDAAPIPGQNYSSETTNNEKVQ